MSRNEHASDRPSMPAGIAEDLPGGGGVETLPALALDLAGHARRHPVGLVFVDATGDRLDVLADAAAGFDPALDILVLPAIDTLPYDRTTPSPAVTGRRVATLCALAAPAGRKRLVITSARAMMARVPPPSCWQGDTLVLAKGDAVQPAALAERLRGWGYAADEHVDEPGHFAIRGHVIDLFAGDAVLPVRLTIDGGTIMALHRVDPVSQRSDHAEIEAVTVRQVVEQAPEGTDLACALDNAAGMALLLHHEVPARWAELHEQAIDAHAATLRARRVDDGGPRTVPPPSQLFCTPAELGAASARLQAVPCDAAGHAEPVPPSHRTTAAGVIRGRLATGRVIVAAGAGAARLHAALARRAEPKVRLAAGWADALDGPADTAAITALTLGTGFRRPGLSVVAVPAVPARTRGTQTLIVEEPPRWGDIVVHRERGVCRLRGLKPVGAEERIALEFADDTELLVPAEELDQVWRYGSEAGRVALDRVDGTSWHHRRDAIAAEIAETARGLAAAAAARAALRAPAIHPPASPFARFVRRFPYPLSPDQEDAIEATLADLASGRPMDRLVCGDVGFGKTEVALRAAAAVALSGRQVAVVAPTTVLARQHCDTFTRRFSGFGVRVEPLLRGASSAAGRSVRAGLADGSIAVVVGTQAVAAEAVRFRDLALVVIDEEQRFGDAHKRRLSALRNPEGGVHALVMTATPIPRTLQTAMVGLRAVSVIATPPVRRQPTRTFVMPWDGVVVREALLREHARGGQSFVVCPRIEDLAATAARLAEVAPELSVVRAHGKLPPATLETVVADFTAGRQDVLLATNIIEAGLDIPRANTILITRPDRFGLSQLHQMRGRVGRGQRRGSAYMLTEPGRALAPSTQRRLQTLSIQTQLGAGVAISLADMDARGAGDLFGERQAGHVHAIGTELYQQMLTAEITGDARPRAGPDLRTGTAARIPEALVPEPNLRLELYRRLARLGSAAEADELAEELDDRLGEVPAALRVLLDQARLRVWCVANGVARLDAGPNAVALTTADASLAGTLGGVAKQGRVILPIAVADPVERLARLCGVLLGP